MESEIFNLLADLGVAGAFITYLAYTSKAQAKKLDDYVDRLLDILGTIEKEREVGFDKVRDRYDEVIAKYDAERDMLLINISSKLDDIQSKAGE
jgi:thymidylate kinase